MAADADLVQFVERLLAGVIGAASARITVTAATKEDELGVDEVMSMLDEASELIVYSHQLEQKSRELEATSAELRAANERLLEVDRLKDDFVSTVSHELRTPLTSIRSFSEILQDHPELEASQRIKYLDIIVKESERLTRLINQVLDLAKIESGQAEWRIVQMDVTAALDDALTSTGRLFEEKDVRLDLLSPGRCPSGARRS